MDFLPNIYRWRHYKRLIILPILMILVAMVFIPKIPAGIDLRGGILITMQAEGPVDEEGLRDALKKELGVHEVRVKSAPNPAGESIEIEIDQNEHLAAAERALRHFYEKYDEMVKAEYRATALRSQIKHANESTDVARLERELEAEESRVKAAEEAMDAYAETLFSSIEPFIGPVDRSNVTTKDELMSAVVSGYAEARESYKERVLSVLREHISFTEFAYKEVSPSLSEFFLQKTTQVVVMSFLLTTIVIFIVFRSFVPSVAVLFGAFSDIIIALGAMGFFGIPLTLPSIAALLMLIGYSLDTDVLLTIRIMKRKEGDPRDRAYGAMGTGLLMSITSISAFFVLFLLSMVTQLSTYYQISAVAICGLLGDIVATWCTNAVIVLWHVEKKGG